MIINGTLAPEERISLKLRSLYETYGYMKYRMSKFENYDLYAENRAFLPGGGIITFTDNGGNLLAMKPDVTLSIANGLPQGIPVSEKIYYSENVYRIPSGSKEYKEIMQLGIECIGDIDLYSSCEVLSLAVKSLAAITDDYILDISHIGFISGILAQTNLSSADKERLIAYINRRDAHDITKLCDDNEVSQEIKEILCTLTELYLPISKGIEKAKQLDVSEDTNSALRELEMIAEVMDEAGLADKIYLDFSVADNVSYYDGVKFKGYVNGIFSPVLAGGSYGNLLKKLKKRAGAIGFAVYMDLLSEYGDASNKEDDIETLVYDKNDDPAEIMKRAEALRKAGKAVRVVKEAEKC